MSLREYFVFDKIRNKSKCKVCGKEITGNHATNLRKHLKQHKAEYKAYEEKEKETENRKRKREEEPSNVPAKKPKICQQLITSTLKKEITIKMDLKTLDDACVDLIANGRPLLLMNDPAFHKIVDPILDGLKTDRRINRDNVREKVLAKADQLRGSISAELKQRMFSIKFDGCSKKDRSVLGIRAQFMDEEGQLHIRTLAVVDLTERHTAEYINFIVTQTFEDYSINPIQVYCATTDNGANLVKAVQLMEQDIVLETYGSGAGPSASECEVMDFEIMDDAFLDQDWYDFGQVRGYRCAAHTLQLALEDVWKAEGKDGIVPKARKAAKQLKKPNTQNLLKKTEQLLGILDCETRWKSTFFMLERLRELKNFIKDYEETFPDLKLSDAEWDDVERMITTLKPLVVTTERLEAEELTMADLIAFWTECKLQLRGMDTDFSHTIVRAMEKREATLFDNDIFCASVFMDPRLKSFLNTEQKARAISHLQISWKNMQQVEKGNNDGSTSQEESQDQESSTEQVLDDPLELYLSQHDEASSSSPATPSSLSDTQQISNILQEYSRTPRIKDRASFPTAMDYWISKKEDSHSMWILYRLAMVALAAPATQVSVERLFSHFAFILSPLRSVMKPDLLQAVLLLRSHRPCPPKKKQFPEYWKHAWDCS